MNELSSSPDRDDPVDAGCDRHAAILARACDKEEELQEADIVELYEALECVECEVRRGLVEARRQDARAAKGTGQTEDQDQPALTVHEANLRSRIGPVARGLMRIPGEDLVRILAGKGPRIRDRIRGPSSLYDLVDYARSSRDRSLSPPPARPMLWHVTGDREFERGWLLDELFFVLLEGDMDLQFRGGEPVNLSTVAGQPQILWASADPRSPGRLPPVRVSTSSGAIGIAFAYHADGVAIWGPGKRGRLKVKGVHWSDSEVEAYWQAIDDHVPQMAGRRPYVSPLAAGGSTYESVHAAKARDSTDHEHEASLRAGHLVDREISGWPLDGKEFIGALQAGEHDSFHRLSPAIDFCLIDFPAAAAGVGEADLAMVHHSDCVELLIPLAGSFTCLAARPFPGERRARSLGELTSQGRAISRVEITRKEFSRLPDLLLLESRLKHGFHAAGGPGAALALRCHDLNRRGHSLAPLHWLAPGGSDHGLDGPARGHVG